MLLGRYTQQPGEKLKRILDYASWLESSETITGVTAAIDNTTEPALLVPLIVIDPAGKKFAYYVSEGADGETYTVTFTVTTQTQIRKDEIEIEVEDV